RSSSAHKRREDGFISFRLVVLAALFSALLAIAAQAQTAERPFELVAETRGAASSVWGLASPSPWLASRPQQAGFGVAIPLLTTLLAVRRRRVAVAANVPDGREATAVNAAAVKYLAAREATRKHSPEQLLVQKCLGEAPGRLC